MIFVFQVPTSHSTLGDILLILAIKPDSAGNIGGGNTKTPVDIRAAIPLLNNQFDGVLFELFGVIWTFSFLVH